MPESQTHLPFDTRNNAGGCHHLRDRLSYRQYGRWGQLTLPVAAAEFSSLAHDNPHHRIHFLAVIWITQLTAGRQNLIQRLSRLPGRPCRSTACPSPMPATVLRTSLTAFDQFAGRLRARARSTAPSGRPTPGRSTSGRRSVGDTSLRRGKQGDTVEAIAPDAAGLRSGHVARRMDNGSS
jgi:hypothetical protein